MTAAARAASRTSTALRASFPRRLGAYLIDLVLVYTPTYIAWLALGSPGGTTTDVIGAAGTALIVVYFIGFWMRGATPGMKVFDLRIVSADSDGRPPAFLAALVRLVGLALLQGFLLVPFFLIVFLVYRARQRPYWHDRMSGTTVLRASESSAVSVTEHPREPAVARSGPILVGTALDQAETSVVADRTSATAAGTVPTTELGREMRRLNEAAIAGMHERLANAGRSASALGFCGNCGRPRDEASSKFCRYCGTPLPAI